MNDTGENKHKHTQKISNDKTESIEEPKSDKVLSADDQNEPAQTEVDSQQGMVVAAPIEARQLLSSKAGPVDQPEELPSAEDSEQVNEVAKALANISKDLTEFREHFTKRLDKLDKMSAATTDQIAHVPAQIRMIASKIEGLTTAVGESRHRALLMDMLRIYDLVDQVLRGLSANSEYEVLDEHRCNYEILRTQIQQILELNGLSKIPVEGKFNPKLHRAVQSIPCEDQALANHVAKVVRDGFRTEQNVLRFAEVEVYSYEHPQTNAEEHGARKPEEEETDKNDQILL